MEDGVEDNLDLDNATTMTGTPQPEEDDDLLEDLFESQSKTKDTSDEVPKVATRPVKSGHSSSDSKAASKRAGSPVADSSFAFLSLPSEIIRVILEYLLYSDTPAEVGSVPPPLATDLSDPLKPLRQNPKLLFPLLLVNSTCHVHAADLLYSSTPTFLSSSPDSLPNFVFTLTSSIVPDWRRSQYTLVREVDIGWSGEDFYEGPVWKRLLISLEQLSELTIRHNKTRARARERHGISGRDKIRAGSSVDPDSSALLPVILNGLVQAGPRQLKKLKMIGFSFDSFTRTELGLLKGWAWLNRGMKPAALGMVAVPEQRRLPFGKGKGRPEPVQPVAISPHTSLSEMTLITCRFCLQDLANLLSPPSTTSEQEFNNSWLESLVIEECSLEIKPDLASSMPAPDQFGRLPKWSSSLKRKHSVTEGQSEAVFVDIEEIAKRRAEREQHWKFNDLAVPPTQEEDSRAGEDVDEESFFYEAYAPGPYTAEAGTVATVGQQLQLEPSSSATTTAAAAPESLVDDNALPILSPAQKIASDTRISDLFSTILEFHGPTLHTLSFLHNSVFEIIPDSPPQFNPSVSFPIRSIMSLISATALPSLKRLALDLSTCAASISLDDLAAFFSGLPKLEFLALHGMPGDKVLSLSTLSHVTTLVLQGCIQPTLDPLGQISGLKNLYLLDCRDLLWAEDSLDALCPVVGTKEQAEATEGGLENVFLRLGVIQSHLSLHQGTWFSNMLARGYIGGSEVLSPSGEVVGKRKVIKVFRVERGRGPGAAACNDADRVRRPVVGRRADDDFI